MSDHRSTILGIYQAFGRGDIEGLLEFVAEEPDWGLDPSHPAVALVPWIGSVRTKAEVASVYFAGIAGDMDVHVFEPRAVAVDGDHVVTALYLEFTVRSTGKRVATDEAHHFQMGPDGRVAWYRPIVESRWEEGFRP